MAVEAIAPVAIMSEDIVAAWNNYCAVMLINLFTLLESF